MNVLDWFFIMLLLFVIGISVFVSHKVVTVVDESGVFADTAEAQNALDYSKTTILNFDNLMLFIIVGLSLFVLISSALIYNHPSLFILGFFLLAIAITFAGIVSNTFWAFSDSTNLASTTAAFPKIIWLMEHLPFYILFMGVAALVVAFISYQQ